MENYLIVIAVLVAAGLLAWLVGKSLPREHTITRNLVLSQPRERVWNVLTNYAAQPEWHPDIEEVIRLEGDESWTRWRELHSRDVVKQVHVVQSTPPRNIVWGFREEHGFFEGQWNVDLADEADATRIEITQRLTLDSAWARLLALIVRRSAAIDLYLGALETYLASAET